MRIFQNLMSKVFGRAEGVGGSQSVPGRPAAGSENPSGLADALVAGSPPALGGDSWGPTAGASAGESSESPQTTPAVVDVEAILDGFAAKNPEKLEWRRSIVDLMKLLDMDGTLEERKDLAAELGYTRGSNHSAEMNIWLHKQVLKKLSENGGKVPPQLLDQRGFFPDAAHM